MVWCAVAGTPNSGAHRRPRELRPHLTLVLCQAAQSRPARPTPTIPPSPPLSPRGSYGANVARLAGLPDSVVRRAATKAAESEAARQAGSGEQGSMEVDGGAAIGTADPESARQLATPAAAEMLQRVRVACRAAAGGQAGAAADVLALQRQVRELLQLG